MKASNGVYLIYIYIYAVIAQQETPTLSPSSMPILEIHLDPSTTAGDNESELNQTAMPMQILNDEQSETILGHITEERTYAKLLLVMLGGILVCCSILVAMLLRNEQNSKKQQSASRSVTHHYHVHKYKYAGLKQKLLQHEFEKYQAPVPDKADHSAVEHSCADTVIIYADDENEDETSVDESGDSLFDEAEDEMIETMDQKGFAKRISHSQNKQNSRKRLVIHRGDVSISTIGGDDIIDNVLDELDLDDDHSDNDLYNLDENIIKKNETPVRSKLDEQLFNGCMLSGITEADAESSTVVESTKL